MSHGVLKGSHSWHTFFSLIYDHTLWLLNNVWTVALHFSLPSGCGIWSSLTDLFEHFFCIYLYRLFFFFFAFFCTGCLFCGWKISFCPWKAVTIVMLIFALNPEACQKAIAIVSAYYKHFNIEKWHTSPLTIKRDDMNYMNLLSNKTC